MFAADPLSLARVALFATVAYVALVALIRVLGPRTISRKNPSDFAITVAIGSTVANLILSKEVALAEGLVAISVLLGLQFGTEWVSTRSTGFRRALEGTPRLLFYRGQFVRGALEAEHVTETAVYRAIREHGAGAIERVRAVILESDGEFTVIGEDASASESALDDVRRSA